MSAFPYDLILFDLDGTLIETAPEIADAVNDTLSRFDLPAVTQPQVNDWIGHGTRELLIQAIAATGNTTADTVRQSDSFKLIEAEFGKHYQRRCGTRSRLYPHVRETLQALRAAGLKLVVMTNKEGRYTRTVLDAHQLAPLFDHVISGDTLPVKKPNPAGIADCLQRFGVAPGRALFVGDSSIDVATARNGGIAVWALPYGYNMGEPIEACGPDRVIPDFSALTTGLPARDTTAST
ncbi:HAD family hydrolase [Hydrogenophaga sp. A37]|uniref:HAD family hydrolase n=1 Tax=Hydrogenophaga sp. A37 TaxID=1945864 RepID=UPI0009861197|nr:HAD family hydrolase [Hydrogenophaga sp. A37]OOG79781.1 phosphoglycolate phosphatase [Hydrogenophaga sp. A37]